jgi:GMP reductase
MTEPIFDFQQINLVPKLCIVDSRSECDTSVHLGKFIFNLPVVPANMESVINEELCIKLARAGYFYIHHRFNVDIVEFVRKMHNLDLPSSISIGVNEDAYEILREFISQCMYPDYITIDIAHGHSIKMKRILEYIRAKMPSKIYVIAGNVCTPEGIRDLENWGANAVKIGIGPGSACTTYHSTGFGSRGMQAWTIQDCTRAKQKDTTDIIADGGIKDPGDIVKSISFGATMVMVGGLFSAHKDSPGATIVGKDDVLYKEFWGSASASQSNKENRIEGIKKLLPMVDKTVLEECEYLTECFQSAISYAGGNTLDALKHAEYYVRASTF